MLVSNFVNKSGRHNITAAPDGHIARLLINCAIRAKGGIIHIVQDDIHLASLFSSLEFFAPENLKIIQFPAWDCLPYDRSAPKPEIIAQRMAACADIIDHDIKIQPLLVLTTVNAILQRLPPPADFGHELLELSIGSILKLENFQNFVSHNGYNRSNTVREQGEYAIRGGILDIFPPSFDTPIRIDLFGDEIDGLRSFDPLSQLTIEKLDKVTLRPMSEFAIDDASIMRFRKAYRGLFGVGTNDPLYEAISEGRKYPGMEHWQPLFHKNMSLLTDFLPKAVLSFPPQMEVAIESRFEQIEDFYQTRLDFKETEAKSGQPIYNPLPTNYLYPEEDEFAKIIEDRTSLQFSPFTLDTNNNHDSHNSHDGGGKRGHDFAIDRAKPDTNIYEALKLHIKIISTERPKRKNLIAAYSIGSRDRLAVMLREHGLDNVVIIETYEELRKLPKGIIGLTVLGIEHGFISIDLAVISEQDILGDRIMRASTKKRRTPNAFLAEVSSLKAGDLVVHIEHGVGRYEGLETMKTMGAAHDFLRVTYAGDDRLFVPVENIEVLSRYGEGKSNNLLDRLGGTAWQAKKSKVKKRLKDMAESLMRIASTRVLNKGESYSPPEGLFEEFCARFPYNETPDQLNAIEDVLEDLGKTTPMDRLVCGDVGFGKTEVALRAAFVAAMSGAQVAVVVPTTLLARQHYQNFAQRFKGMPVRIAHLSRLVKPADAKRTKEELSRGTVDIVIGTHSLLAKTINFAHLGLMIIDEEQRFGVKQKEKLKNLREMVHVLTLTATPIPRTLQLALSGVKEMSLMASPPIDRLAVRTFVLAEDKVILRDAIMREYYRGGQVFYVCPRIKDLPNIRKSLAELVPDVKVVTATGQLAGTELEEVMTAFDRREYDVLLATNIIENGIDIPNANTLIIHRSDMFSLSQLYQLRGRVGRGKLRGYAYLTYDGRKILTKNAKERLHVIETLDSLGAGFNLASYDLDIRGAGNLLGEEQSGQIKEVGIELYQHLLEEAVAEAKNKAEGIRGNIDEDMSLTWSPQINLGMPVLIPETYVTDLNIRLSLYRRLSELSNQEEIEAFAAELIDRFGRLPIEVNNLIDIIHLKQLCRKLNIIKLDAGPKGAIIAFFEDTPPDATKLMTYIAKAAGTIKIRPDQKLAFIRHWESSDKRIKGASKILKELLAIFES